VAEPQRLQHLGVVEATGTDAVPVKSVEDEKRLGVEPRAWRPQGELSVEAAESSEQDLLNNPTPETLPA